jgi:RNA polymerase sigma-70 factor (ECF subfamily)
MIGEREYSGEEGRFRTTQWSMVLSCADSDALAASEALSQLCQKYWAPLYVFCRRHGRSPEDAQDAVQGFFLHMIQERAFARADAARGRFRNFLLGAFVRFLASESQRAQAQKRGGGSEILSLDIAGEETRLSGELTTAATAERAFEERWAVTVVEHALTEMETTARARGRGALFTTLRPYLTGAGQPESYSTTAAALGLSESGMKTLVHRFRREFGAILRREVVATLSDPSDLEEELRHLRSMLADILA